MAPIRLNPVEKILKEDHVFPRRLIILFGRNPEQAVKFAPLVARQGETAVHQGNVDVANGGMGPSKVSNVKVRFYDV